MTIHILGVNTAYHESSACLLRDGEIVSQRIQGGRASARALVLRGSRRGLGSRGRSPSRVRSAGGPAEVAATEDMAVQMRHGFAGIRAVVEHEAEAGLSQPQFARHLGGL